MGKDSLAQVAPAETAIGPLSATARRLVNAWLDGRRLDDAALAAYLSLRSARRQGVVLDVIYSDRAAGPSRIERHRQ